MAVNLCNHPHPSCLDGFCPLASISFQDSDLKLRMASFLRGISHISFIKDIRGEGFVDPDTIKLRKKQFIETRADYCKALMALRLDVIDVYFSDSDVMLYASSVLKLTLRRVDFTKRNWRKEADSAFQEVFEEYIQQLIVNNSR